MDRSRILMMDLEFKCLLPLSLFAYTVIDPSSVESDQKRGDSLKRQESLFCSSVYPTLQVL